MSRIPLIDPAATTRVLELTEAERAALGIPEALVRYSVGIEDPADLLADLDQALQAVSVLEGG